jgi:hypothetical protein
MDAMPLTLRSAPSVVEVIELAPTLPKELDPTLYEDLVVAMRVVEVAPDGTTSEPKVRWCLAASTGVHVKPNRRHERGYVIDLANRIIVQRLVGNKDLRALYVDSVEKAKVQDALDEKALEKELAPTPMPCPKPLTRAPPDHALPCLLTPCPVGGGDETMLHMTKPAAADLFNGVSIALPRECDTFGGSPAPLRRSVNSPPPRKGRTMYRNIRGELETPSLIGAEMGASIVMARGPAPPQTIHDRPKANTCDALPLTLLPRPFREWCFRFAQTETSSRPSASSRQSRLAQAPARAPSRTSKTSKTPTPCATFWTSSSASSLTSSYSSSGASRAAHSSSGPLAPPAPPRAPARRARRTRRDRSRARLAAPRRARPRGSLLLCLRG